MDCAWCHVDEDRIHGYCSVACENAADAFEDGRAAGRREGRIEEATWALRSWSSMAPNEKVDRATLLEWLRARVIAAENVEEA